MIMQDYIIKRLLKLLEEAELLLSKTSGYYTLPLSTEIEEALKLKEK